MASLATPSIWTEKLSPPDWHRKAEGGEWLTEGGLAMRLKDALFMKSYMLVVKGHFFGNNMLSRSNFGQKSLPCGKAKGGGVCLERTKGKSTITIDLNGAAAQCLLRGADQRQAVGTRLAGKQLESCRPSLSGDHDSIHRAWHSSVAISAQDSAQLTLCKCRGRQHQGPKSSHDWEAMLPQRGSLHMGVQADTM
ncbi:MAG: hypothetical protein FRX49_09576 [Trebouxia sp. A1-2]|nr:MAG: hypothetical protein FRX49_09576 [Trebouxia sp. A1-2]